MFGEQFYPTPEVVKLKRKRAKAKKQPSELTNQLFELFTAEL